MIVNLLKKLNGTKQKKINDRGSVINDKRTIRFTI